MLSLIFVFALVIMTIPVSVVSPMNPILERDNAD